MGARNKRLLVIGAWVGLFAVALIRLIFFTHIQTDISVFLPKADTVRQSLLVNELRKGPESRIWLIALEGGTQEDLVKANKEMAGTLRKSGLFRQVLNGENLVDSDSAAQLMRYRYLLDPRLGPGYFSTDALRRAFKDRLSDLGSPLSTFAKRLIPADPTYATLAVMKRLQLREGMPVTVGGVWFSRKKTRSFLVAETKADGVDLNAQAEVFRYIKKAFRGTDGMALVTTGVPFFALQTKARVQAESQLLFSITTVLLLAFIYLVYRNGVLVLLTALPLLGSVVVAGAAVSMIFGAVHGITLVFGGTLLGVAVDYPVHVLSHAKAGESLSMVAKRIWPTLRLGVVTTVFGYLAMVWTNFVGLAQLGVFTIAGLLCAAYITRNLIPALYAKNISHRPSLAPVTKILQRNPGKAWRYLAVILVVALSLMVFGRGNPWSNNISDLSPIPAKLLNRDQVLRREMGTPEAGQMILVKAKNLQQVLDREEALEPVLDAAADKGFIGDFDSAARILPSAALQRKRQKDIPDRQTLSRNVEEAVKGLGYEKSVFAPFIKDASASRGMKPLTLDELHSKALAERLRLLIRPYDGEMVGVVRLIQVTDAAGLNKLISESGVPDIWYMDIKKSTDRMVQSFRDEVISHLAVILGLIVIALLIALKKPKSVMRTLFPVVLGVLTAAVGAAVVDGGLNIFHLVSLMLIGGVGLDYALFFLEHTGSDEEEARTLHALIVCCISTVMVFTILASSKIPVLHAIGLTVAIGITAVFAYAWLFARPDHHNG